MSKTAYNPYEQVKNIYNYKNQWVSANNAGDDKKKQSAANNAAKEYEILRANGYGDVADELSTSGVGNAKLLHDYYGKTGRTDTRSYLYSLGNAYGLSKSDIDNLISFDDQTKEISFGGKKIGKADAIVDGVSYWSDTTKLDNAFADYTKRAGVTRSSDSAVSQENERLFNLYAKEYEDLKNTNPFDTAEAKAIMGKYDLSALQGRDNAVASGSASNGGNIDSFAAANAMRQQASLVAQGQEAVLASYNQKLSHARALLADMGVNIDRVFDQGEAGRNRAHELALEDKANMHEYNMTLINNNHEKETAAYKDIANIIINSDISDDEKTAKLKGLYAPNSAGLSGTASGSSSETPAQSNTASGVGEIAVPVHSDKNGVYYEYANDNSNGHIPTVGYREEPEEPEQQLQKPANSVAVIKEPTPSKPVAVIKEPIPSGTNKLTKNELLKWEKYIEDKTTEKYPYAKDADKNTVLNTDLAISLVFGAKNLSEKQKVQLVEHLGWSPEQIEAAVRESKR